VNAICLLLFVQAASAPPGSVTDLIQKISPGKILSALMALAAVYLLVRTSDGLLNALGARMPRARFFFLRLAPLVRFALWVGGGMMLVAGILAPTRDTLFALLAAAGVALGLGAQDLVKNLIGGLVILSDRPYQLGDRVKIGDAYGEIDHIGLRSTKLTTSDDTRVTIPNSEVLTGMVWNANSGALDCQVVTKLYLPPTTDPKMAMEIGYESACSSPYALLSKPVVVRAIHGFQEAPFLLIKVKAYVYDHRFEPAMQSDITTRAATEFLRRGVVAAWG
jgi:small-conductance mechanosensitive channel